MAGLVRVRFNFVLIKLVFVVFSNTPPVKKGMACSAMAYLSEPQMATMRKLWNEDFGIKR